MPDEKGFVVGSPEWFHEQAQMPECKDRMKKAEELRASFIDRFSPRKLKNMDGNELLRQVFDASDNAMIRLLMHDHQYCDYYGSAADRRYLSIVFNTKDGRWWYQAGKYKEAITKEEAAEKAVKVRDGLVFCTDEIEKADLSTIAGYRALEDRISRVFFYKYTWVLKYFQMIYPQFFPGMYVHSPDGKSGTIDRAIHILGLPQEKNKRFVNAGKLSLFIRKCDINNVVFNRVYYLQWDWVGTKPPCPNAANNALLFNTPIKTTDFPYYATEEPAWDYTADAERVEKEIAGMNLRGQDREAVVRVRVNQGEFRERLLKRYGKCCLCGVSDERLLVASHIKPWAESKPEEKLDPDNGFLLCPNHDRLFDQGFITFSDDGKIEISSRLSMTDRLFMNVTGSMEIKLSERSKKFILYHRENIFEG